ncbi:MAG: glycosyltransferase family 2 protein [Nitrosopumilaceae archaeon]
MKRIYSSQSIPLIIMLKVACIPAYNEERSIGDMIKRTLNHVDKVIVCDDGSDDGTLKKAKDTGAVVIRHEKNLGKGAALKSLFKHAKEIKSDVVVTIDGDGQFLPEEIEKLIKPILDNGSDIVIGYRFSNDKTEMPSYRKAGNKILDKITNIASDLPFRDTQSGFRAYSKKAIELIRFTSDGFGADSEILVDASQKGLKISEVKVSVIYDTGGKTSTKHPVTHSAGVLTSLIELIAIRHPLKYLGIPGLILIIIGTTFSVSVISIFNETRYFSIPFTLVALGSIVIGVILLLMSVVLFSIVRASRRTF